MACYVESHRSRKCPDVNAVADEFRNQMTIILFSLVA